MKTLACCYLTHNHPEVIDDILNKALNNYAEVHFDILIYDDSDNDLTKTIVRKYINAGASNLFYIDAHGVINSDDKYLRVIKGWQLPKEYDYILPTKDRTCYGPDTLSQIRLAMENGYDVIMPANEDSRWSLMIPSSKEEYNNPTEFYRLYGFYTTNWECLIRKTETMLTPIAWEKYESVYRLGIDNNFNQTLSLFIRLSELDNPRIKIINGEYYDRYICTLVGSLWRTSIFSIWIDKWIAANFSLPDIYNPYKLEVIKSETALNELFGSVTSFISLKEDNIFSEDIFLKYYDIWPMITDLPKEYLHLILAGNYNELAKNVLNSLQDSLANHDYDTAYRIIQTNTWLKENFKLEEYNALITCFRVYKNERNECGFSSLFDGISSIDELLTRYNNIINS